jgi:hypothetical protein
MKAFRVEHLTKKAYHSDCFAGPYGSSGSTCAKDWTDRLHSAPLHPSPQDDIINCPSFFDEFICGFKSLNQLKSWFNSKELDNLKNLGFIIAEYTTSDSLKGNKQIIFIGDGERIIHFL